MKKIALLIYCLLLITACSDDEAKPKIEQCEHEVYSGPDSCDAGYVSVPGGCCPATNPWYCSGMCYLYCSDAAEKCGENVVRGKL